MYKLDPDPHKCANVNPKCMEYEPILALFIGFEPFFGSTFRNDLPKSCTEWNCQRFQPDNSEPGSGMNILNLLFEIRVGKNRIQDPGSATVVK
jgi:hypothetical protein